MVPIDVLRLPGLLDTRLTMLTRGANPPLAPCVIHCAFTGATVVSVILVNMIVSLRPDEAMLFVMVKACLSLYKYSVFYSLQGDYLITLM